jgi:hypothetical protein
MIARPSNEAGLGDDEATDELVATLRQERDRLLTERDESRVETEAWRAKAEEARLRFVFKPAMMRSVRVRALQVPLVYHLVGRLPIPAVAGPAMVTP